MFLPPPDKSHWWPIIELGSIPHQPECSWPIRERPILGARVAQEVPLQCQVQPVEIVACSIHGPCHWSQVWHLHLHPDAAVLTNVRPALRIPGDRCQEGLAPEVRARWVALRAHTQAHQPPAPIVALDQVGVAERLDRTVEAAVGQNGIVRTALPWSPRCRTPRDRRHMAEFGATLGDQEIVVATDLVEVRSLRESATSAGPNAFRLGQALPGRDVDLALLNAPHRDQRIDLVWEGETSEPVAGQIYTASIVESERGVDAALIEPDRFGPRTKGVTGVNKEVATTGDVGRHHVEDAVVIADCRGEDTARGTDVRERQLAQACQAVPDLAPMHQVAAVEQRHAREILERAGDQKVVLSGAADAGIGVKARYNGIGKRHRLLQSSRM